MKILVTGGVGFIGSHIVDSYLAANHEVVVIDNFSTPTPNALPPQVEVIRQDLKTCNLSKIFADQKFDVVNHHAAQVNVRNSIADPANDAKENIITTLRLLQACVDSTNPVAKFIFASSGGAIYGDQEIYPTPESADTNPESPYGIAKLTAEMYMEFYRRTYQLRTTVLRYSNVYGPRQDPQGEAGVISIFIDSILKNESPTIFGTGAQTRDFVYVKDVARANVFALREDVQGIINIGNGHETTINELTEKIKAVLKNDIEVKNGAAIPGELHRSCVDINHAKNALDWQPMTNLQNGLSETVQYIKQNKQEKEVSDERTQ